MAMSKPQSRNAGETSLRHVWLAGLGLASVARREAINAGGRALADAASLQRRARDLAEDAKAKVLAGADSARDRLDPIVAKVNDAIGVRLAPVLEKLGLRPRGVLTVRRTPVAKSTARRVAPRQPRRSTRKA